MRDDFPQSFAIPFWLPPRRVAAADRQRAILSGAAELRSCCRHTKFADGPRELRIVFQSPFTISAATERAQLLVDMLAEIGIVGPEPGDGRIVSVETQKHTCDQTLVFLRGAPRLPDAGPYVGESEIDRGAELSAVPSYGRGLLMANNA